MFSVQCFDEESVEAREGGRWKVEGNEVERRREQLEKGKSQKVRKIVVNTFLFPCALGRRQPIPSVR